jgi:hypothetical protein
LLWFRLLILMIRSVPRKPLVRFAIHPRATRGSIARGFLGKEKTPSLTLGRF